MCIPALIPVGAALLGTGGTIAAGTAVGATAAAAAAGAAAAGAAASVGTMAVASLAGTAISTMGAYSQAQASKQIASNNAKTAEYAAQEASRLGEKAAIEVQRKGAAVKSAQRVGLAAKGLDLGYGTAADLQDQTDFFTQSDVATTRTNAAKDAWGKRAQGANYQAQANAQNPLMMAGGSLISGASTVASRWYK
jgi:hypothetical protein